MWHGELSLAIGEGCGSTVGASWHFLSDQGTWETASLLDLNGRAFAVGRRRCRNLCQPEVGWEQVYLLSEFAVVIGDSEGWSQPVFRSSTFIVPIPLSGVIGSICVEVMGASKERLFKCWVTLIPALDSSRQLRSRWCPLVLQYLCAGLWCKDACLAFWKSRSPILVLLASSAVKVASCWWSLSCSPGSTAAVSLLPAEPTLLKIGKEWPL